MEAGEGLAEKPGRALREKKERRNALIARFETREDTEIVYQDESWFSRYQMPRLRTFSEQGEPLRVPIRPAPASEPQKAVAVYGALRHSDREVRILCTLGQPNGRRTQTFLRWLLQEAFQRGKRWLLVIWDNASWHKRLKRWAATYNRLAATTGRTRLLLFFLPSRSPWLNPIEPHRLHCKRAVYSVERTPTTQELRKTVHQYFDHRNSTISTGS